MTSSQRVATGPPPRSEALIAWSATMLLALHSCWIGIVGLQQLPNLASLYEGLGIQEPMPAVQAFFSSNPSLFLAMFVTIAAALVAKEALMNDKRRSIMITCLVAVLLLIIVDVTKVFLVDPIYRLIVSLS